MAKLTKKQKLLAEKVDAEKLYGFDEALALLKEVASKKFDETVEVAMNLGVDPRHADQMVRGMVSLPAGTGKEMKVAVFAKGDKADEALKAGADKVGAEDLMEDMQAGNIDYDRVIATPDMMGVVGRLGQGAGQHQFAALLGCPGKLQVRIAELGAAFEVVGGEVVGQSPRPRLGRRGRDGLRRRPDVADRER